MERSPWPALSTYNTKDLTLQHKGSLPKSTPAMIMLSHVVTQSLTGGMPSGGCENLSTGQKEVHNQATSGK